MTTGPETGRGRRAGRPADRRAGGAAPTAETCLVCGEPTGRDGVRLCSRTCVRLAREELEVSARGEDMADGDALEARTRLLRSALIAWSPN